MKRHPGLVPLSHEHRQLLFVAQVLKKGVPRYHGTPSTLPDKLAYAREMGATLLLPHQAREEALLFPIATDAALATLTDTLIAQHRAIAAQLTALDALQGDDPHAEIHLDNLGHLIEAHIRTEERELFQQLQAILRDEVLVAIGEQWQAGENATCHMPQAKGL